MESSSSTTTVQQQQLNLQHCSSSKPCNKPKPKSRVNCQHLFRDYLLKPRPVPKPNHNPKVQPEASQDLKHCRVVLHKLQFSPYPVIRSATVSKLFQDASTQTTGRSDRPNQDSSTQTIDPYDRPSPEPDRKRRFSNSSLSENELEAIKQHIVDTEPKRQRHSSDSSHNPNTDTSNNTIDLSSSSSNDSTPDKDRLQQLEDKYRRNQEVLKESLMELNVQLQLLQCWVRNSSP
jgi:hypothetical protein